MLNIFVLLLFLIAVGGKIKLLWMDFLEINPGEGPVQQCFSWSIYAVVLYFSMKQSPHWLLAHLTLPKSGFKKALT